MNSSKTITIRFKKDYSNYRVKEYNFETKINKRKIISGFTLELAHFKLKMSLINIAMTCYKNPIDWINSLKYLIQLRRKYLSDNRIKKMVKFEGKYYMGLYMPGWNSQVYKRYIATNLNDFKPVKKKFLYRLNSVFLGITKKCNYK